MKTKNIFLPNVIIANKMAEKFCQAPTLLGEPQIKIFTGRDHWLSADGAEKELSPEWQGEKMDYLFMEAETLKKYAYHPGYHLDLKTVLEKFGDENTKVIIFSCCSDCNNFVREHYKDITMDFFYKERCSTESAMSIIKKYFSDLLVIDAP